jgi:PilZ domain
MLQGMQERRQNVRVRPTADYGIVVDHGSGLVKLRLAVIDLAVGGVAIALEPALVELGAGAELRLGLTLPGVPRIETVGTVRYSQRRVGGRCGVHLNHLSQDEQHALSRAVSELLERGASA